MSTRVAPDSAGLAWLGLALVLGAVWLRAEPLRDKVAEARASRAAVVDDATFYRVNAVLGPEAALLEAVQRALPPGSEIAVTGEGSAEHIGRRQRFWLALLPHYRVTADAPTEICPRACATRAAEVLAEGASFVWIRRAGVSP